MAMLSRRLQLLAIFLYDKFKHHAQIDLRQHSQFLSTQHCAYQSFLVASWFDSVCIQVASWVNCRHECLHDNELQLLSDYNV